MPGAGGEGGAGGMSEGVTEEFVGLTTDGTVVPDLFSVYETGVSTDAVVAAATAWLATLTDDQKASVLFDVDPTDYTTDEWRMWSNVDGYTRQGLSVGDMTDDQKTAAMGILEAGLSAQGLETSRNIMKLNEYAGVLIGSESQFNEGLYWFTIMGTPSSTDPWGWQIDGHHLVINYFVLGDQVVMTPTFMGSEPVNANFGLDHEYEGVSIFTEETALARTTIQTLSSSEQSTAITSSSKTGDDNVAEAFKDNLVQPYEGVVLTDLGSASQAAVIALIARFVGNMDDGHAAVKMAEVNEHLDETYFAWVGGTGDEDLFYFRVQSPVIWIEFDFETPGPVGRGDGAEDGVVSAQHIHSDVRTPNGNDYGKSLLALHLALDH
ncbi:DUF3500 domain-containing protein [Rathayibacter oskolensis]|uniref:DUF3500 domain-containing protein n=1 Tax=Rathayibacter oskolensis TaxID=1891671 RepID=UPI00265F7C68|nr:DUF3500 domain-containing protein [Rathayibacter oskolensis]WKK70298.1 DUF3500 domain-containing protein [Rathayibacter oskolensis]